MATTDYIDSKKTKELDIYTDGGSRGNPGNAAIGVVIYNSDGLAVEKVSEYIGEATNNQAEYNALIVGLQEAQNYKAKSVHCYLDSELVVKQMKGQYKVKNENMKPLFTVVQGLIKNFESVKFTHIPREKNKEADRLVNLALDKAKKS
ncbi:MAG: ribonuclease HI family protein [Patescibacteria group bacterium]|jgi:ribonuclease HI